MEHSFQGRLFQFENGGWIPYGRQQSSEGQIKLFPWLSWHTLFFSLKWRKLPEKLDWTNFQNESRLFFLFDKWHFHWKLSHGKQTPFESKGQLSHFVMSNSRFPTAFWCQMWPQKSFSFNWEETNFCNGLGKKPKLLGCKSSPKLRLIASSLSWKKPKLENWNRRFRLRIWILWEMQKIIR